MELLKKYGRDFLYHYQNYVQFVKDLNSEQWMNITDDMKPVCNDMLFE